MRIRLPSTRIRWKRSPKTQLFENALQSGIFWKRRFRVFVWTGENGTFRKRWRISIGSSLPARKKMAGYGDFMFLLCQENILGCQKHLQSYWSNYFYWRKIPHKKQIQINIFRLCNFVPHLPLKWARKIERVLRDVIFYLRALLQQFEYVKVKKELIWIFGLEPQKSRKRQRMLTGSHAKPSTPTFCICLLSSIYLRNKKKKSVQ